ncbi:uracil-DNA glycosylase [Ramlibacter rhizophilus]|uniref:Uracil-DNA glycosylase n=1 Tax=Ramlibacter rhizophilus TaxID=1781167 RepID=A0A4Z0BI96_9BURK|nr:uracil-DNA glycosylase [Ramlibacter rhizophilus]TFY98129.1 uracil-DNA glycosylase [Ramlibacter rhizophilus]
MQASLQGFGPEEGADRLQAFDPAQWPVAPDWRPVVDAFFASPPGQALGSFLRERLAQGAVVFPPRPLRALELTPLARVHAVILGQDPYHGLGQAEGLAFSVAPGVALPPSLRNIFQELGGTPASGSLVEWARRGVLLLNTCLTVEEGRPASHAGQGWERLTDALLARVAETASPCAYLLWGAHAQAKAGLVEQAAAQHGRKALVLKANHPSPLSARRPPVPFIGCGHFRLAREWLAAQGCTGVL